MILLIYTISVIAFLFLGALIGWLRFNVFRWVGIKRRFSVRNWGIIYFKSRGKSIFPVIADFDSDTIKVGDNIWILDKGKIYRQGDSPKKAKEIQPSQIEFISGCPVTFFNIDDMLPLHFEGEKDVEGARNPHQVEATLAKEIAAAEAEALHMTKTKIQTLIIIAIICAIIGIGVSAYGILQTSALSKQIASMSAAAIG